MTRKHLWEIDHPYYCEEGGYYYNSRQVSGWGEPMEYRTFSEFLAEWEDADLDMNFVFRWDWSHCTQAEHLADHGEAPDKARLNREGEVSSMTFFLMMQRKGCKKVLTVTHMEKSDEPRVIEFLSKRWERMREVWAGVSYEVHESEGGEQP